MKFVYLFYWKNYSRLFALDFWGDSWFGFQPHYLIITSVKAHNLIIGDYFFKMLYLFPTKKLGKRKMICPVLATPTQLGWSYTCYTPLVLFHLVSLCGITIFLTLLIVLCLSVHHWLERKVCCECMVWKCTNQGEKEVMETKGQKINKCISISMEGDHSGKVIHF